MKKLGILLLSTMLLIACGDKKKMETTVNEKDVPLVTSSNEDEGIKEILDIYAGKLTYGVGKLGAAGEETGDYFQLELIDSDAVDDFRKTPEMPASNVAYLYYKHLNEKERVKYDEVHTVLHPWGGTQERYRYSTEQLERVDQRMKVAQKLVSHLKNKNLDGVKGLLNNELFGYDKEELMNEIRLTEPQLGNISEFLPYGYTISETETGQQILHISGALIRDIENNGFSMDLDLNSDAEEVLFVQYKL